MQSKELLLIGLIVFIAFFSFLFLRENVLGADAYYYVSISCGLIDWNNGIIFPLEKAFFEVLPCIPMLWKVLLYINTLFFAIVMWFIFKELKQDNKLIGLLLLFSLSFITFQLTQLENDYFALPFLALALFFNLKNRFNWLTFNKNTLFGLISFGVACSMWGGSIYYGMFFALFNPIYLLSFANLFIGDLGGSLIALLPNILVQENIPFYAIYFFAPLLLIGVFNWKHFLKEKKILIGLIIFSFIAILNAKFWFLIIPFVSIFALNGYNSIPKTEFWNTIKKIIPILCIALILFWNVKITNEFPSNNDWEAMRYAKDLNQEIHNDWGIGYNLIYLGAKPLNGYGSYFRDNNQFNGITILNKLDKRAEQNQCVTIQKFNNYNVYNCNNQT